MNNWLMELRLNKNVSQTYIAKQSNITRQYYNLIENHRRRPSPQVAQRIAAALGFQDTWYKLLEQ